MKQLLLPFFLTLFAASFSLAQGLVLLDADNNDITGDTLFVHGDAQTSIIKGEIFFHNDSDEDMQVLVKKTEIDILEGTHNAFCWNDFCFTPDVYEVTDPIILEPGETSGENDFYVEYYPGGQVGVSIISYEFFSRNDGFDEVLVTVVIETEEDTTNIPYISDDNEVRVSIHPNPASSVAVISHNLQNVSGDATLTIRNINGALIGHFHPDLNNTTFTLDVSNYPNGIYLYNLTTDTGQISSGRLIISK